MVVLPAWRCLFAWILVVGTQTCLLTSTAAAVSIRDSCLQETKTLYDGNISTSLYVAYSQLLPRSDCDTNFTTCTLDYSSSRANVEPYTAECLDEGGHFYTFDLTLNCSGTDNTTDDANPETTTNTIAFQPKFEQSFAYPSCVGSSCNPTEAQDFLIDMLRADDDACVVAVSNFMGPMVPSTTGASNNKNNNNSPPSNTSSAGTSRAGWWWFWTAARTTSAVLWMSSPL